jgi:PKD repeat protein
MGWLLLAPTDGEAQEVVYIEPASSWRWRPGDSEASEPREAWRESAFDDSSWLSGPAPFGYGDPPFGTDLSEADPPMRRNYTSVYLRHTLEIPNPALVVALEASVDFDDGFILWINGVEVASENAPADPAFDERSARSHESGTYEVFDLPAPSEFIVAGTNTVAVQFFNATISSSDSKFDLSLVDPVGIDTTAPVVAGLLPGFNARIRNLQRVEVTFSEAVSGLDAADLLINNRAADTVSGSEAGPYIFRFEQPAEGEVTLRWADQHGIRDLFVPPNDFAGGSWSYVIDPEAPVGQLVINELLTSNQGGLRDEDGDSPDWIELRNLGAEAVELAGWTLTDDAGEPGKWSLPGRRLLPGDYLVVFASGKDRTPAGGNLHANFKLETAGEYLGLFGPNSPRQAVSEFSPAYPPQRTNLAWGRTETGIPGYLATPTPGESNAGSDVLEGVVADPAPSHPRGFYGEGFTLELTCATEGASIYYTLNGSEPTEGNGTLYSEPVPIAGSQAAPARTVRAAAFRRGQLPSVATTWTYIFPQRVLSQSRNPTGFPGSWPGTSADYEMDPQVVNTGNNRAMGLRALMNLPAISVVGSIDDLFGSNRGVIVHPSSSGPAWEREVTAELILPDGDEGFQIPCGIRVQGGSSTGGWKSKKTSYRLAFRGDYGQSKLRYDFFPGSPVKRFDNLVLDAHLNLTFTHPSHDQRVRSQYIRDMFVSDLQLATGSLAPRSRLCSVFLNGLFWGVFDVHERPDNGYCEEHLGGEKSEWDIVRHNGGQVVDGNSAAWNAMMSRARANLGTLSNYNALQEHLDVLDIADYMLVNFYTGNDDWPHHNWYGGRRRTPGGVFRFFSWDAEHVLKDVNVNRVGVSNNNTPAEIYNRLRQSPEWRLLFADRVHEHFFNGGPMYVNPQQQGWNPERPGDNRPAAIYMRRADQINLPMVLEAARWGDVRREPPYTREGEWSNELNWLLRTWFPNRSSRVLQQLRSARLYPTLAAPEFSRHGGEVAPGFSLSMSLPGGGNGTIYYTTDGSDPRTYGSGELSASASAYSEPLRITQNTAVLARARSGETWSALNAARFSVPAAWSGLAITEIMYHAPGGNAYDFIELANLGDSALDLGGLSFTSGISFEFAEGDELAAGGLLVLAADGDAFATAYPAAGLFGSYEGSLANEGESIRLKDRFGNTAALADYDDDGRWPLGPDGFGYSLVPLRPGSAATGPESWRASAAAFGSPGATDPEPRHGGVVINEVLSHSDSPLEDAVELFNPGTLPVDISGWYLSDQRDDSASLRKYRIPGDVILAGGGYHVIYENAFQRGEGLPGSFAINSSGDELFLSSADAETGELTGYITGVRFDALDPGVSWGRLATSSGIDYGALQERSFGEDAPASLEQFRSGAGAENSGHLDNHPVISEIHYHPDRQSDEFIELYNPLGQAVALFDEGLGLGWRLRGVSGTGEEPGFELPSGASIPARGFVVLSSIDPGLFRQLNELPGEVAVYGPYGGALDNGGEALRLLRPVATEAGKEPAWVLVDRVRYSDRAPWPAAADGEGPSLERRELQGYGNEPDNWGASQAGGGSPGAANTIGPPPPNLEPRASFSLSPESGFAPLRVDFDGSSSNDEDGQIISWSWDFGDGLGGTGESTSHTFDEAGEFLVTLTVRDDRGDTGVSTRSIRVRELGPNERPVASFTISATRGAAPFEVQVDASASFDPDGKIVRYDWDFGDGAGGIGETMAHTWDTPGQYLVTLIAWDDRGGFAMAFENVIVDGAGGRQLPGDCNQDSRLDISDAVCLLGHLFLGSPRELPCGDGEVTDAANRELMNLNGDRSVDLTDAIHVLRYLFQGGPGPVGGASCLPIAGCPETCRP